MVLVCLVCAAEGHVLRPKPGRGCALTSNCSRVCVVPLQPVAACRESLASLDSLLAVPYEGTMQKIV